MVASYVSRFEKEIPEQPFDLARELTSEVCFGSATT